MLLFLPQLPRQCLDVHQEQLSPLVTAHAPHHCTMQQHKRPQFD
jgi:hypothetical protein